MSTRRTLNGRTPVGASIRQPAGSEFRRVIIASLVGAAIGVLGMVVASLRGGERMSDPDAPKDVAVARSPAEPRTIADAVQLAIPLGIAAVVAAFVALGLEGDQRERLIRNEPGAVWWAFTLAVVGISVPLFSPSNRRWRRRFGQIGGILVLSGVVVALITGARGLGEREQPGLGVVYSVVPDSDDTDVHVDISASAPSLRSTEKMLLRVAAVKGDEVSTALPAFCRTSAEPQVDRSQLTPDVAEPYRVLYWGESGPTKSGSAAIETSEEISTSEYSHLCVYAALYSRGLDPELRRDSYVVIDLRNAPTTLPTPPEVEPTATPTPTPSGSITPAGTPEPTAT